LKPVIAKTGTYRLVGSALAVTVACVACGNYSTQGAADPFVGMWSCPTLPAGAQTLQINAYADNSLSVAGEGDAGSLFCASDLWSYSGSTVSMKSGTSCLGGATGVEVLTVQSFSLTRNGSDLVVSGKETLTGPGDAGARDAGGSDAAAKESSGPPVDVATVTLSGTCVREGVDAG